MAKSNSFQEYLSAAEGYNWTACIFLTAINPVHQHTTTNNWFKRPEGKTLEHSAFRQNRVPGKIIHLYISHSSLRSRRVGRFKDLLCCNFDGPGYASPLFYYFMVPSTLDLACFRYSSLMDSGSPGSIPLLLNHSVKDFVLSYWGWYSQSNVKLD